MILLDTDVVVDLLRRVPQAVAWFDSLADEELVLPGFVAMELIQGCRSRAELKVLQDGIRDMLVVWPSPEVCDGALHTYSASRFSHGVGLIDALVGQLAASLDLPLHTFNRKHYAGVAHLKMVAPYQR